MVASERAFSARPIPPWRPRLARFVGHHLRFRGTERLVRTLYSPADARADPSDIDAEAWDGTLLRVDPSSYIEWMTFVRGGYERDLQRLMHRLVAEGDAVVDVGANVGIHTCSLARRVGPAGMVVAVEPLIELADRLEFNIALNGLGNVKVMRVAASASAGVASIFPPVIGATNQGQATLHARPGLSVLPRTIPTDTVDSMVAELGLSNVRLMKVDVEGHELSALRGAEQTLRTQRPRVLFEFDATTYAAAGVAWRDIASFFAGLGYRLREVRGTHTRTLHNAPSRYCMVLALPSA